MSQKELLTELSSLFGHASDREEMAVLIEGLLTPGEIEEIVFRWRLLTRLLQGQPQREISRELSISLGKIARGSRLLKYGLPEFRELIERFQRREAQSAK